MAALPCLVPFPSSPWLGISSRPGSYNLPWAVPGASILGEADDPSQASKPNRQLVAVCAAFLGRSREAFP